jgi:hypothetical protein
MWTIHRYGRIAAAVALLATATVVAQAQDTPPSVQQLMQENKQLMQELDAFKASMNAKMQELEDKIQAANAAAAAAKAQSEAAQAQSAAAKGQSDEAKKEADATAVKTANAVTVSEKLSQGRLQIGHTNIFFNGWVEGSMGYRKHDELAGPSQTSVLSPYPVQAQYGAQEFEAGPPQTRFGINTISDESRNIILRSKLEFDLLSGSNAANTANGSSYTPRLRHAWAVLDDAKTGWHFEIGQGYSLTIPNGSLVGADGSAPANVGWKLLPGSEVITQPDDGVIMGLGTTRSVQFRVVKEIARNAAVAVSLENNIVTWGGDKGSGLGTAPYPKPVYSQASYSSSSLFTSFGNMPDVIGKVGWDPTTRYHFEAWGILRQYRDRSGPAATYNNVSGSGAVYTGGGNIGTYTKVIPTKLDFHAGLGYGSFGTVIDSAIPDVTYDSTGKPVPIMDNYLFGEFIAHPNRNLDIYFQSGVERGFRAGVNAGATTANAYGYGNPFGAGATGNAACMVQSTSSLTATCQQDTQIAWNYSITPDWRPINTKTHGHLDFMPQVEYVARRVWKDQYGYAPRTSNVAIDICFRYWPF